LRQALDAWRSGARRVLFTLPTGGGKTTAFGYLASQLSNSGKRTVILVHRRELASQAANRLREFGVDHGLILAGEPPRPTAHTQIASVQTLVRRRPPPADLVICDEAHLSTAKTWATLLEAYPNARILGVTATPWRLSGKPLAGSYDACVVVATPAELRELGFLSPYTGFSYKAPDLSGVKTTGGDYNERQSAEAMSQSVIVDSVVEEWVKHASHLSTVVFAVTVEHSQQLTSKFRAAGVAAEHLDGSTPLEQRRAILRRVERGETRVLCNVGVAVEGLDIPRLKCCVLARPTKSLARAIQMMGRVRRPFEGLTARIHDHAFVIAQHGLPDDERDYRLSAKPERPPSLSTCEKCLAIYTGNKCPACGVEKDPVAMGERVINTIKDAEQVEFSSGDAPHVVQRPPIDVRWDAVGRVVEGVFEKTWEEPTQYGTLRRYLFRGEKRNYNVPGTARLNALMSRVQISDSVRITYTGDTPLGEGRVRKEFKVEVDDAWAVA
jgi:DNA repair protein RadD